MIRNFTKNKILWFLNALLSFIAALTGVFNTGIYDRVVSGTIMPGVFAQDLMTLVASCIILVLIFRTREADIIRQMVILGFLGFLFYAYGIYVIERLYNALYFLYMAIFGLSFYSIVYGVVSIREKAVRTVSQSRFIRNAAAGFLLFNALMFYPLWIGQLLPLIRAAERIEFLYSIYILDLCFIMPAFIIIAVMTLRNNGLGLLLTPSLCVMGFTLLFPLALAEFLKPLMYGMAIDTGGLALFLAISLVFGVLAVLYLLNIKISVLKT